MKFSATDIATLILKKLSGQITGPEAAVLEEWVNASAENKLQYDALLDLAVLKKELKNFREAEEAGRDLKIPSLQNAPYDVPRRVPFLRRGWTRYAAAIILLVGVSTAVLLSKRQSAETETGLSTNTSTPAIIPGSDKATLTLSDGTIILLDSASNGTLAQQGNSSVIKKGNGEIQYQSAGQTSDEVLLNTMATPNGGQYQLTLPDGTKVWLNAASSITYPAVFAGNQRNIKMKGEAYFEVAKDKNRPFIVDIDGESTVEVLGTSFNINSYADDGYLKTTLVEGSVNLNNQAVLKPGQQARIAVANGSNWRPTLSTTNASNQIQISSNTDMSQILAWKNGLFNFHGLTVREVMNQLARWYDISVRFEGKEPELLFMGKMYRNADLSEVLKMLEKLEVRFKMEGRTLVVL